MYMNIGSRVRVMKSLGFWYDSCKYMIFSRYWDPLRFEQVENCQASTGTLMLREVAARLPIH